MLVEVAYFRFVDFAALHLGVHMNIDEWTGRAETVAMLIFHTIVSNFRGVVVRYRLERIQLKLCLICVAVGGVLLLLEVQLVVSALVWTLSFPHQLSHGTLVELCLLKPEERLIALHVCALLMNLAEIRPNVLDVLTLLIFLEVLVA